MKKCDPPRVVITGIGIASSIGHGKAAFTQALLHGRDAFAVMQRAGRQKGTSFLGAEMPALEFPSSIPRRMLRTSSWSAQAALCTVHEAWQDAGLNSADPCQIGLIVGGSNFQQREMVTTIDRYAEDPQFLHPLYALSFLDSDVCGLCTEQFGIGGFAYTMGGASASGQLAVIAAAQAVASRQVDVCIAVGALMDLSFWELQAMRSLGAMGSDRYADQPHRACRPFDRDCDGFIFGEACGAVVVESLATAEQRKQRPYAVVSGWSTHMDRHRNPDPGYDGEVSVIRQALRSAHLEPDAVDYINPHGTGSRIGDRVEAKALKDCALEHAFMNATKSILGHGLSAAGTSEIIATLVQMEAGCLHPTLNLENPIEPGFNWVRQHAVPHAIHNALCLSLGFGGINTAVCLSNARLGEGNG